MKSRVLMFGVSWYLYLAWFHVVFSAAALRRRSKYGER
jgi:hypothetical protein